MNPSIYLFLFFLSIFIKYGYNYETGAPNGVCTSMTAGHGVASQQCSSKYTILADKSQYYTNETVRLTVKGSTSNTKFKGILLAAKTQTNGQIIGTWVVVSSTTKIVNCNGVVNSGITHNSNTDKSSIEALWYPPSTISDVNTIVKATIVTSYNEIYVDCFNITLTARQTNQSTNGTHTSTALTSTSTIASTTSTSTASLITSTSTTASITSTSKAPLITGTSTTALITSTSTAPLITGTSTTASTTGSSTTASMTSTSTAPLITGTSTTASTTGTSTTASITGSSPASLMTSTSTTTLITTTVPETSGVGVNITWIYINGVTAVKMRIKNLQASQWFALGLSLDQDMGEDHVFVCRHLADNTVSTERRINPSGYSPPVLASTIASPGGTFSITLQKLDDGIVSCEFTLSNFINSKRRRRDIFSLAQSMPYYPLLAIGNSDSSNTLKKHTSRIALSRSVQLNREETIIYNLDSTDSDETRLMKAHGIIMIFTWILFVSTGILLARYFKTSWPDRKICGKPIWFAIHRLLMTSVTVLTVVAFLLILVYEKGKWVSRTSKLEFAHSIIGILVISFAFIQPMMSLFRCEPDAQYRFIFNYGHRIVGLTSLILSIVAIFLAMFFTQFNFETNKEWGIVVAWTCWLPIIFLIFSFIEHYFEKESPKRKTADFYDMNNENVDVPAENDQTQLTNHVKKDRIKGVFLFIHIIIALGLSLALAIFIGKI